MGTRIMNFRKNPLLGASFLIIALALGCAKSNDNTTNTSGFVNRGSAVYSNQVTQGMGFTANLAVDVQYADAFLQTLRGLYSADGNPQLPGPVDPVNGVKMILMPINFNPSNGQAVITTQAGTLMTIWVTSGGQNIPLTMSAQSGARYGANQFYLTYVDNFRTVTIDAACASTGLQGNVYFHINQGPSAGPDAFLGYFSMNGFGSYCNF